MLLGCTKIQQIKYNNKPTSWFVMEIFMLFTWISLIVSILAEVAGSSMLIKTEQFTRLGPSVLTLILYAIALIGLSMSVKHMPLGIVYSIWSGVGLVLTALVGRFVFKQTLDMPAIVGMIFIVLGVLIINFMSRSVSH